MSNAFRTPQQAYLKQPGHYDQGQWVEGGLSPVTIQASIQPATQSDYDRMQVALDGRRVEAMIRVYSDQSLTPAGENLTNGDEIDWMGDRYLVIANSPWRNDVISHFRMLAARKPE